MKWIYHDGGRSRYYSKEAKGDCVTRAIAIATGRSYQFIYETINEIAKNEKKTKRRRRKSSAESGVYKVTRRKVMEALGWEWVPTMGIGTGCKVHLRKEELPPGRLIVSLSKHLSAVIDGVIYDTYDPSRNGTRCVYGYYREKTSNVG